MTMFSSALSQWNESRKKDRKEEARHHQRPSIAEIIRNLHQKQDIFLLHTCLQFQPVDRHCYALHRTAAALHSILRCTLAGHNLPPANSINLGIEVNRNISRPEFIFFFCHFHTIKIDGERRCAVYAVQHTDHYELVHLLGWSMFCVYSLLCV